MQEGPVLPHADGQTTAAITATVEPGFLHHHTHDRPDHGGVSASFAFMGDLVIPVSRAP